MGMQIAKAEPDLLAAISAATILTLRKTVVPAFSIEGGREF